MKKCEYKDCDEIIMDWQKYCYIHKRKIDEEKKMNEQQNYGNPTINQPPTFNQPAPNQDWQNTNAGIPQAPQPPQPVEKPTISDNFIVAGEMSKLSDRDRLIVKQVSMKIAIDLLGQTTDLETSEYKDLMGKLQRLTVDVFKIIVSSNEEL